MGTWCGLGKKPWRERGQLCLAQPVTGCLSFQAPGASFPEKMNRWNEWSESPIQGWAGVLGWKKQLEWAKACRRTSKWAKARDVCGWSCDPPCPPSSACWSVHAPVWRLCGSGWGGQCYGRRWREALDSWLSERGGCQWRVWEGSTARSQRQGWGKDEGLAVVWVKYRPRPVLEGFFSQN